MPTHHTFLQYANTSYIRSLEIGSFYMTKYILDESHMDAMRHIHIFLYFCFVSKPYSRLTEYYIQFMNSIYFHNIFFWNSAWIGVQPRQYDDMQAWMFASICKLAALKWLGLYKGFHYNREWGIGERNFLIVKTRIHKQEYETLFSLREKSKLSINVGAAQPS